MKSQRRHRGARVKGAHGDEWDDLLDESHRGKTADELKAGDPLLADVDPASAAIVINTGSGRCRIFWLGREIDCIVPPEIAANQRSALTVGDRVVVEQMESGAWRMTGVVPRRSVLSRPDPQNPHLQRLIAANIDVVVHVVSV